MPATKVPSPSSGPRSRRHCLPRARRPVVLRPGHLGPGSGSSAQIYSQRGSRPSRRSRRAPRQMRRFSGGGDRRCPGSSRRGRHICLGPRRSLHRRRHMRALATGVAADLGLASSCPRPLSGAVAAAVVRRLTTSTQRAPSRGPLTLDPTEQAPDSAGSGPIAALSLGRGIGGGGGRGGYGGERALCHRVTSTLR